MPISRPRWSVTRPQSITIILAFILACLVLLASTGCFQRVDRIDFANLGVEPTLETVVPTNTPEIPPTIPTPTEIPTPEPTETPSSTPVPLDQGPYLEILEPVDGITVLRRDLTVKGITNVGNVVTVNGAGVNVDSNGQFTDDIALSVGINVVQVVATTILGEQRRGFVTVVYLRPTPPPFFLLVTEPTDQVIVANQIILVSGKTIPQAAVTVNGVGVRVDEDGNFSTPIRLSSGSNVIDVLARNTDNRTLSDRRIVHYSP